MVTRRRLEMRAHLVTRDRVDDPRIRAVVPEDASQLASLLIEAYRGTIDDEDETPDEALAEMRGTIGGKYGGFRPSCSFVVEDAGALVSACLVTEWEGMPLIAFSMTHPAHQNQGFATTLLELAFNAMIERGYREARLLVTIGNDAAIHVYEKLGFRSVREFEADK
jgi:ribosomal protein S18 acetylase RimI-like enzyme